MVAWSGMRGLVTLATAFALPDDFPQRDVVVLTAVRVVLATLVVQGFTLAPLIRRLELDRMDDPGSDLAEARRALARVGLERIDAAGARGDLTLGDLYRATSATPPAAEARERLRAHRRLGLAVVEAQRRALERLRDEGRVGADAYHLLQ